MHTEAPFSPHTIYQPEVLEHVTSATTAAMELSMAAIVDGLRWFPHTVGDLYDTRDMGIGWSEAVHKKVVVPAVKTITGRYRDSLAGKGLPEDLYSGDQLQILVKDIHTKVRPHALLSGVYRKQIELCEQGAVTNETLQVARLLPVDDETALQATKHFIEKAAAALQKNGDPKIVEAYSLTLSNLANSRGVDGSGAELERRIAQFPGAIRNVPLKDLKLLLLLLQQAESNLPKGVYDELARHGYVGVKSLGSIPRPESSVTRMTGHAIGTAQAAGKVAHDIGPKKATLAAVGLSIVGQVALSPSAAAATNEGRPAETPSLTPGISLVVAQPPSTVEAITTLPVFSTNTPLLVVTGGVKTNQEETPTVTVTPEDTLKTVSGTAVVSAPTSKVPENNTGKPLTIKERLAAIASTAGPSAVSAEIADDTPAQADQKKLPEVNPALDTELRKTVADYEAKTPQAERKENTLKLIARLQAALEKPNTLNVSESFTPEDQQAILEATGTGLEQLIAERSKLIEEKFKDSSFKNWEGFTPEQRKLMVAMLATVDLSTLPDIELQNLMKQLPPAPTPSTGQSKETSTSASQASVGGLEKMTKEQTLKSLSEVMAGIDKYLAKQANIAKKLIDRGMSPHIAIGFSANARDENSSFEPGKNQVGGPAAGLFQWEGPRLVALKKFAATKGLPWDTEDVQLDFVMEEIKNGGQGWNKIKDAKTAEEAATLTLRYYERAADSMPGGKNDKDRRGFATALVKALQKKASGAAETVSPMPSPAEGITKPTRPEECAVGTVSLGFYPVLDSKGKKTGEIMLCAITEVPSTSDESNPNSKYYIPGSDRHAIVSAEASEAFSRLVADAQAAGLTVKAKSSYRSFLHQKELCEDNYECRNRISPAGVSYPGGSKHEVGIAIDWDLGVDITRKNCVMVRGICSLPKVPGANRAFYTFLVENGWKYGIYQYSGEFWHFNYDVKVGPQRTKVD